jgi:hypothetical protein
VAAAAGLVELVIGPHRVVSLVFLVVGPAVGAIVGRGLARALREWADDAPALSADERDTVVDARPAPYAIAALVVAGVVAVLVPVLYRIPTPLPGGLAAIAVQAWLQARDIARVGRRRAGQILRPAGRLSFSGDELRLLPDPAGES